ncbi:MAG: DUF2652 domain-containing protein [Saprospiraceae bacterium]|nr:DUF2652 domain-containing protein [Saprospiraceae bacterium]
MQTQTQSAATAEALLFIPDISGFTHFVNNTEILHARHIIEELLEMIIDANEIGLEVSEIEGDAILFYRFGKAPTAAALLAQVQRIYVAFQAHLRRYERHRICHCGACSSAQDLTLKFIAHFGKITTKSVKDHNKLFGKEVIVAHRLMKNEIDSDEYVLVTHSLMNSCETWVDIESVAWSAVAHGSGEYDFGSSQYCFLALDPLMEHVPEPKVEDYRIPGCDNNYLNGEAVINAPLDLVFDVVSDTSYRHVWQTYVARSDHQSSKLGQNGISHQCVVHGENKVHSVVSHDFKRAGDVINFTDTNMKDGQCAVYTLRKIAPSVTRVSMNCYMKPHWFKSLMFKLMMKKKVDQALEESWKILDEYCSDLHHRNQPHTSQILLLDQSVNA